MHRMAARVVAAAFVLAGAAMGTQADERDALYRAEAIVTGQLMPERLRGFRLGAEEVLIKLTGRPSIAASEAGQSVIARGADMVADLSYEDRMKDIPIHDEQGTRDRPYYLRMRFDPEKVDKALAAAKIGQWTAKRPTVAVWLGIRDARGGYILANGGQQGYEQRQVLKDASRKRAVPIVLPGEDQTAVAYGDIETRNVGVLRDASKPVGADCVLYGLLEFDGEAHWNVSWTTSGLAADVDWKMTGVTFDQALKAAIDRVMTASVGEAPK